MQLKYLLLGLGLIIYLILWLLLLSLTQSMLSAKSTYNNITGLLLFLSSIMVTAFLIAKIISTYVL